MAKRRERERNQQGPDPMRDPRVVAAIDLLRRSGAQTVGWRYHDDQEPVLWLAEASWLRGPDDVPVPSGGQPAHDCAGALDPLKAVMRLLDQVVDGGRCAHCGRPTGVEQDFAVDPLLPEHVCWYQYDPELNTFRRSCEGGTMSAFPPSWEVKEPRGVGPVDGVAAGQVWKHGAKRLTVKHISTYGRDRRGWMTTPLVWFVEKHEPLHIDHFKLNFTLAAGSTGSGRK